MTILANLVRFIAIDALYLIIDLCLWYMHNVTTNQRAGYGKILSLELHLYLHQVPQILRCPEK